MDIYDYLTGVVGWKPTSTRGNKFYGCCPFHPDRHPSFQLDLEQERAVCFSLNCGIHGDLVRMIWANEFQHLGEDYTRWRPVFERYQELTGKPIDQYHFVKSERPSFQQQPVATPAQSLFLDHIRHWSHALLQSNQYAKMAHQWLVAGGMSATYLPPDLGFFPGMSKQSRFPSLLIRLLREQYGTSGWQELARSTGILVADETRGEAFRLHHRMMFFCREPHKDGRILFYSSRTILPPPPEPSEIELASKSESSRRNIPYIRYLETPGLKKYPFFLLLASEEKGQPYPGTVFVESPKGPLALLSTHLQVVASLGNGMDFETFLQFPDPWYIAFDNDVPHRRRDGTLYYPGDDMAKNLLSFAQRHNRHAMRVHIPMQYKDPDTWVKFEGVHPLLRQIEQYHRSQRYQQIPQRDCTFQADMVHSI